MNKDPLLFTEENSKTALQNSAEDNFEMSQMSFNQWTDIKRELSSKSFLDSDPTPIFVKFFQDKLKKIKKSKPFSKLEVPSSVLAFDILDGLAVIVSAKENQTVGSYTEYSRQSICLEWELKVLKLDLGEIRVADPKRIVEETNEPQEREKILDLTNANIMSDFGFFKVREVRITARGEFDCREPHLYHFVIIPWSDDRFYDCCFDVDLRSMWYKKVKIGYFKELRIAPLPQNEHKIPNLGISSFCQIRLSETKTCLVIGTKDGKIVIQQTQRPNQPETEQQRSPQTSQLQAGNSRPPPTIFNTKVSSPVLCITPNKFNHRIFYAAAHKSILALRLESITSPTTPSSTSILGVKLLRRWKAHSTPITSIDQFDSSHLITGSEAGTLKVWIFSLKKGHFRLVSSDKVQKIKVYKTDSIKLVTSNRNFMVTSNRFGEIRIFSFDFNQKSKKKIFKFFEKQGGINDSIRQLRVDDKNRIYVLKGTQLVVIPPSYLVRERSYDSILKERRQNHPNARIKRLEYMVTGTSQLIAAYHDETSGSGYLTLWRHRDKTFNVALIKSLMRPIVDQYIGRQNNTAQFEVRKSHMSVGSIGRESKNRLSLRMTESKPLLESGFHGADQGETTRPRVASIPSITRKRSLSTIADELSKKRLDWRFSFKFDEKINRDGFAISGDLSVVALNDLESSEVVIYDLSQQLGSEEYKNRNCSIEVTGDYSRHFSLALNHNGEILIACVNYQVYAWIWRKGRFESYMLERLVNRANTIYLRKTKNKPVVNGLEQSRMRKARFLQKDFNFNGNEVLSLLGRSHEDRYCFKKQVKEDGRVNWQVQRIDGFDKGELQDWKDGSEYLIFHSSDRHLVVSVQLDYKPQEDKGLSRFLCIRLKQKLAILGGLYKLVKKSEIKKKVGFKSTLMAKEISNNIYLIQNFRSLNPEISSYSEISKYEKPGKFELKRVIRSSSGLCFDSEMTFLAFGCGFGLNRILMKSESRVPGRLPKSSPLLDHLVKIFRGVKNKINPSRLISLIEYLKTNKFAFDEIMIHSELNIPYMAVLSESLQALRCALDNFGYEKSLYTFEGEVMDPLFKAIKMNNEDLLDTFAEYFETKQIKNFNKSLFFGIMSSESLRLKKIAVEQFLGPGQTESDVFIPEAYPLADGVDYKIYKNASFVRDANFRNRVKADIRKIKEAKLVNVRHLTTPFPLELSLGSRFTTRFLKVISECENEVIETKIRHIIREIWVQNYWVIFSQSVSSLIMYLMFFFWILSDIGEKPEVVFWAAIFLFGFNFMGIVLLIHLSLRAFRKSIYNYIDFLICLGCPVVMVLDLEFNPKVKFFRYDNIYYDLVITLLMFLSFGRALTMFRFWDETRYFVAMVSQAFYDIRSFVIIMSTTILTFGLIQIQSSRTAEEIYVPHNGTGISSGFGFVDGYGSPGGGFHKNYSGLSLSSSLKKMFNFPFGNWSGTDKYSFSQYCTFIVFVLFLPLVLMNLLTPIIWATHDTVKKEKIFADYREMVQILRSFNLIARFLRVMRRRNMDDKLSDLDEGYIHMILRDRSKRNKGEKPVEEEEKAGEDFGGRAGMQEIGRVRMELTSLRKSQKGLEHKMKKLYKIEKIIENLIAGDLKVKGSGGLGSTNPSREDEV